LLKLFHLKIRRQKMHLLERWRSKDQPLRLNQV
jgi:hypothetical protein